MGMAVPDHTGAQPTCDPNAWFTAPRAMHGPMPTAVPVLKGNAYGPAFLPGQMVTVAADHVAYTDLYSSLMADGTPASVMYDGTYMPPVTGALKLGG